MEPKTINPWLARQQKAAARKAKRANKRRYIAKTQGKPLRAVIGRGALKKQIVTLLGWLDRKLNGSTCRLGGHCPQYVRIGPHRGEVAYHVCPQSTGDGARFIPENVIWCCAAANFGEKMNRATYRMRHIELFGRERIERIEAAAKAGAKYSTVELLAMRQQIKDKLALT